MIVDDTEFLRSKMVIAKKTGISIAAEEISDVLKPHQRDAVQWAAAGGRRGMATELNADYFRDGVGYLKAEEAKLSAPTLFDFLDDEDMTEGAAS